MNAFEPTRHRRGGRRGEREGAGGGERRGDHARASAGSTSVRCARTKRATNGSAGDAGEVLERARLHDAPVAEQHEPAREERRLGEVVRDEHHRLAELAEDAAQVLLQVGARERVERAERLVEEEDLRLEEERAHEPHALRLTAGELAGEARERVRREARERGELARAGAAIRAGSQRRWRATIDALSAAVRCGKSPPPWTTYPMRRRSASSSPRTGSPAKRTSPASGATRPSRSRRSVDFPEPLSPMSATVSPRPHREIDRADHRASRVPLRGGPELDRGRVGPGAAVERRGSVPSG